MSASAHGGGSVANYAGIAPGYLTILSGRSSAFPIAPTAAVSTNVSNTVDGADGSIGIAASAGSVTPVVVVSHVGDLVSPVASVVAVGVAPGPSVPNSCWLGPSWVRAPSGNGGSVSSGSATVRVSSCSI